MALAQRGVGVGGRRGMPKADPQITHHESRHPPPPPPPPHTNVPASHASLYQVVQCRHLDKEGDSIVPLQTKMHKWHWQRRGGGVFTCVGMPKQDPQIVHHESRHPPPLTHTHCVGHTCLPPMHHSIKWSSVTTWTRRLTALKDLREECTDGIGRDLCPLEREGVGASRALVLPKQDPQIKNHE